MKVSKKSIKIKKYIRCFLIAMIISMNIIRYFCKISESNIMIYSVYIFFIVIELFDFRETHKKIERDMLYFFLILALAMIYALVTTLFAGDVAVKATFKFIVSIVVAYFIYWMENDELRLSIDIVYFITAIYIITILVNPSSVRQYLSNGSNYLVLTLSIGLVLSMQLSKFIFFLYKRVKKSKIVLVVIYIILGYFSLMNFSGRGSILFPFIVTLIMVFVLARKKRLRSLYIVALFCLMLFIAYKVFFEYASSYMIQRMTGLFENNSSEDRWLIWENYIDYILKEVWIIWGGGVNSSVKYLGYYPHNIIMQFIGEFGILGMIFCGYTGYLLIKKEISIITIFDNCDEIVISTELLFYELLSGLLFLFFSFMKSFSLYDGGIFLIFIIMILAYYKNVDRNRLYSGDYVI